MWCEKIIQFYSTLIPPENLPAGIEILMPFADEQVMEVFSTFYEKFYADTQQRYAIIGINPGRFGGGVTGIPFTDPIRLKADCNIDNSYIKKQELSSVFVYDVINAFGGAAHFYKKFYVTSFSPLGYVSQNKNINYYDDKSLYNAIEPFAVGCLHNQVSWGINRDIAFCLGEGKNFNCLQKLNEKEMVFKKIIPLPHPRFIMQYKLKQKASYIGNYLEAFKQAF